MTQADELGRYTANTHTHVGIGTYSKLTVQPTNGESSILIDASTASIGRIKIVKGTAGAQIDLNCSDCFEKVLKVREVEVCVDGITKYMLVVASEPYNTKLST